MYCFAGACRTAGRSLDVIDVVMEAERCSKAEAITKAAAMAGALPKAGATSAPVSPSGAGSNRTAADDAARAAVLSKAWATMRAGIRHATVAQAYLRSRGLDYRALAAAGAPVGYHSGNAHASGRTAAPLVASYVRYGLLSETGRRTRDGAEKGYRAFARGSVAFALRTEGGGGRRAVLP